MADFEFTEDEITDLASRLDGLGEAISRDERALLFAVFQMAGDNLAKRRGAALPATPQLSSVTPQISNDVESGSSLEGRVAGLEARVRKLEAGDAAATSGVEKLEAIGDRLRPAVTVKLSTAGGGVPKLSSGFIGSFRGGQAARVMAADDVSVGVNVGVMF
jgi:hypothetical protein